MRVVLRPFFTVEKHLIFGSEAGRHMVSKRLT